MLGTVELVEFTVAQHSVSLLGFDEEGAGAAATVIFISSQLGVAGRRLSGSASPACAAAIITLTCA